MNYTETDLRTWKEDPDYREYECPRCKKRVIFHFNFIFTSSLVSTSTGTTICPNCKEYVHFKDWEPFFWD